MRGQLPGGLDELLDDDVVFYSPIVYTPQEGKAITKLYLQAAGQALNLLGTYRAGDSDTPLIATSTSSDGPAFMADISSVDDRRGVHACGDP